MLYIYAVLRPYCDPVLCIKWGIVARFDNIDLFDLITQERYSYSNFDRQFLKDFGYDQKLHRDDREHFKARGLHVNDEVSSVIIYTPIII